MPKGGGGGTQTVQQNADPWSGAQPYILQGLHNLQQVYQTGGANPNSPGNLGGGLLDVPDYYPNSTVASMSPWTRGALTSQYQRGAAGSPVTDTAQTYNQWLSGGGQVRNIDPTTGAQQRYDRSLLAGDYLGSNPGLQSAISYATAPVEAAANSAFSAAGRYGSGAHMDQLGRSIGDIASNMAFQNYNMERGFQDAAAGRAQGNYNDALTRMLGAQSLAPTLANQDYFDINQAGSAGSALDAYNQALINADVERYNYGQDADWQRTQDFLATIQGVAPTGSQTVSRQTPNAFSSILGGGLSAAGLASMLGLFGGGTAGLGAAGSLAGLMLSDERTKENIERVGELDNGMNVYAYNYIGDPTTHIGLIAQEVADVKPEAVGMLGPWLAVDYAKAVEAA